MTIKFANGLNELNELNVLRTPFANLCHMHFNAMFIGVYNEICFNHLQPVAGKTCCRAALGRCRRWRRIGTATRRFGCRSPATPGHTG